MKTNYVKSYDFFNGTLSRRSSIDLPCPEVHPLPRAVPAPTINPAARILVGSITAGKVSNAAGVMADRVNPPASKPARKSHLQGDWSPQINPLTVPEMPNTRPETTSLHVARTPKAKPPSKEGITGCKACTAYGAENAAGHTARRLAARPFDLCDISL